MWERYVEPRWVHGSTVVSPSNGMAILNIEVSDGYIYGFIIDSESANDFYLTWESNDTNYSIRVSLPSPGTVQYSNVIPLNEGLPATGEVCISAINKGYGKCRASILVSSTTPVEVLPLTKSTPNWLVTAACVAQVDPLYPLKSKVTWKACVHEYGSGNVLTGRLLWSYRLAENVWIASCCSADIDGDGNVEIIIPPGEYGRYVYCLNGKDGSVKWLYDTGYYNYWESTHITAYDIDMDGKMEVIVNAYGRTANGYGEKIHCISHDGTVKWTYTPSDIPGWISVVPTCVYDIDNDGELEIITVSCAGEYADVVGIFGSDGTIEESFEIPYPPGLSVMGYVGLHNLSVADIGKDGEAEIIAGAVHVYNILGYYHHVPWILRLTRNGDIKWGYYACGDGNKYYYPVTVSDIDGDGNLEILTYAYCFDQNGEIDMIFDYSLDCIAVGVCDIDGDGIVECVGADGNTMYCFSGIDGTTKWSYRSWWVSAPGCLADIDSDGMYEVLFHDDTATVYCIEHDGTLKWYYAGEHLYSYPLWKCDLIDDVNGDGLLEAVAPVGASFRVYVFGSG
jgi:hypothetical protein